MTMINDSYKDKEFYGQCDNEFQQMKGYAKGYKDAMAAIEDFVLDTMAKDATSIHQLVEAAAAQHKVLQQQVHGRCEFKRRAFRAKLMAMKSVLELMAEADYKQLTTEEDTNKENDNG
jgi:hypothetical protein